MRRILYYFRKDLRLHDLPALVKALDSQPECLIPVFILDSHYVKVARCGVNRWSFLLQSLVELNQQLVKVGSQLLVLRGNPLEIFPFLLTQWNITHVYHSIDTEPFWQWRDSQLADISKQHEVEYIGIHGHTLYDPFSIVKANNNKAPLSMTAFLKTIPQLKIPAKPMMDSLLFPELNLNALSSETLHPYAGPNLDFSVPTLKELGFEEPQKVSPYKGGEVTALKAFEEYFKNKHRVAMFEKPKTSPAAFNPPDTTVLSPHLKFGTLSCRLFYHRLLEIYTEIKKHSQPPVSLMAQLYWREFYYAVAAVTPDYHKMKGNPVCLQIDWKCADGATDPQHPEAEEHLKAWTEARTGYPWIDAIMTQLREEGWIHHLARHSVACFLTRGDLYISWERGAEVFEELLLDHDSALNIGNWLWLSSSAFFTSYFRVYSPVAFGKKWDPKGEYVKKYLPQLSKFPKEYIYEPWKAPIIVQQKAGCLIGKDYPNPIVEHEQVMKVNMAKMKKAYERGEKGTPTVDSFMGPMARTLFKKRPGEESNPTTKKVK